MSRFNHWSKPHLLWAWHPCARTTFSAGSTLSRRVQIKSPRRNNNEEWGQLSHILRVWYMSYTIHAVLWWPLFFLMVMIHKNIILQPRWFPNLSASSSAPSCVFLLLRKMCKTVVGWGSDLGVVFPSFCFCHLPKKPFMCPLLPFVWAACHKALLPNNPPTSSSVETTVCHCHFGVKPRTSGSKQQKNAPKSPSLAPNFFPPPTIISSLTPQRALPFQPSLELLGVRLQTPEKDTCFPLHA